MLARLMRARLIVLMIAALAAAGCGSSHRARSAGLILDFTPNAVHAGIYSALAHHYDRANGLRLNVVVPGATSD
jgi:NitT/TauT family transport system substrate-binding protein/putative hydroxymethylpyrimidine transport system substrate-binding protein